MAKKKSNKLHKELKNAFLHRVNSNQYTEWRERAAYWWDFYDGEQLSAEDRKKLRERKQPDLIINMIAPKIDALAGTELEGRTVITARERTFDEADKLKAAAFTRVALRVQEQNDTPSELSAVFMSSLVSGIGWVETTVEEERIVTRHVDEFEMVWDTDDTSKQLKNQKYVFRQRWVDFDLAVSEFPAYKDELEQLRSDGQKEGAQHSLTSTGAHNSLNYETGTARDREPFSFYDRKMDKVLIVEGQYKKLGKKYRFFNEADEWVEVYEEDEAKKMAADKNNIEVVDGWIVYRAYFVENVLMRSEPLEVQTGEFEYIPTVHKRESRSRIPYGVVKAAVDPQKEVNKRRQKALHLLNTKGVIADPDVFENPERVRQEISRPDYFLMKDGEGVVDIQDNLSLSEAQNRVLLQSMNDIESVTGIYNELLGQQTNATSGAAIQRRQQSAVRTKAFAIDAFRMFKDRFGRFLLSYIQAHYTERMLIALEDGTQVILNGSTELEGTTVAVNNIQSLTFDVVVEQTPEFDAPPEELAENLRNVAMNGQLPILLQSPTLAKAFGIRNIDKIIQEMKQNSPSQPQAEGDAASEEANPAQTVPTIQ